MVAWAAALVLSAGQAPAAPPLRLECSFTGEDPSAPELTGARREVSLATDAQGAWPGRLRYELPGAGSMSLVEDGALSCRPAAAAAEGNSQ
ncbi:MAG: hypothetical protein QOD42_3334 [Sphingomonadales bacterium]|jgi:hypothetical protein|nr:hypothetical protein [Sphingomonadales bacterium]